MKRKWLSLFLTFLFPLCFLFLFGCQAEEPSDREQTAAGFIAGFAGAAASEDEQALAAYVGNTYQLNARVGGLPSQGNIYIRCSNTAKISATVPLDEWEALEVGQVIALEGTVKAVKDNAEIILEPAHVTGDVFKLTGKVKGVYHDWGRDGQEYALIWDSSIVKDRQINIYLPEDHQVCEGDTITAQGSLVAPGDLGELGIAVLPDRQTDEVFLMYEPNRVQKEVEK